MWLEVRLKRDGTRAETRFRLSPKRTSPFKSAGASVQSTAGSWDVRISGSNAGYTTFRGSVKSTGYPLHSPVSPSLPLPCAIRFQTHTPNNLSWRWRQTLVIAFPDWTMSLHRMPEHESVRITANILNKQPRTTDKRRSSIPEELTALRLKSTCYWMLRRTPDFYVGVDQHIVLKSNLDECRMA
jgi:hypothetical protein